MSHTVDILRRLQEQQLVSASGVERAQRLADVDKSGRSALYHLVKLGLVAPRAMTMTLAEFYAVPPFDLAAAVLDEELLHTLSPDLIRDARIIPVRVTEQMITIATSDPTNFELVEQVRFATRRRVEVVVLDEFTLEAFLDERFAGGENLDEYVQELYAAEGTADGVVEEEEEEAEDLTAQAIEEEINNGPIVKFVNALLGDAVRRGASDVHFEFYEREALVRFRIDGSLVPVAKPPHKWAKGLISRLKVMSHLDVTERKKPQDGRTKYKVGTRTIDFRVSTVPTTFGEKIVMRVLDKSAVSLDLDALGLEGRDKEAFLEAIQSSYGMLLVTGPTGSGKTTTLYAALAQLNQPDVNIMTVEDPVEYNFEHISQTQVHAEVGMTFAAALRAFLRQDPDIIMVGEIRDQETAEIGLRAALTGHLVLSTLHTNSATETVTRLIEMGLEPFNVAAALNLVIAQRLVRQVCTQCAEPVTYTDTDLRRARIPLDAVAGMTLLRGRGCPHCHRTGYKGRCALYEVLQVTPAIRDLIAERAPMTAIRAQALRDGMRTLRDAGLEKMGRGITTLEEVVAETSAT